MPPEERFKKRYESGDTPWDIGKPDINLIQTVTTMAIGPCKALDIGCGTGDNSIWLSQKSFQVTGVDISELAIQKAIEKASKANVKCTFMAIDFLTNKIQGRPFGFAFDRGCFHSLKSDVERTIFAENVAAHLEKDGLWLSLIGNVMKTVMAQVHRNGPPGILLTLLSQALKSCRSFQAILGLTAQTLRKPGFA